MSKSLRMKTMPATIVNDLATVLQECDQRGDDYMQMADAVLSILDPRSFVPREDYARQVGKAHGLEAALRRAHTVYRVVGTDGEPVGSSHDRERAEETLGHYATTGENQPYRLEVRNVAASEWVPALSATEEGQSS